MATCSCDNLTLPDCPDIPPGLVDLPLQARGFGEFRRALISEIGSHPALRGWSAEAEQDLGVMLLEMWAYVLDITRFYDTRITEEFFLSSAKRTASASRLVKLLGYRPRPALSAKLTLVAEADGTDPLPLPEATAFRSEAFDDEPPQLFSLLSAQTIDPTRNRWSVAPIPGATFPGRLLLRASDAGVPKSGIVAVTSGGTPVLAGTIAGVETVTAEDGQRYSEVTLEEGNGPLAGEAVADLRIRLMGLSVQPTSFGDGIADGRLILDTVYPQIRDNDLAVLEKADGSLKAFRLDDPKPGSVIVGQTPAITDPEVPAQDIEAPVTTVKLPAGETVTSMGGAKAAYRLHVNPLRVGRLAAPALTDVSKDDIVAGTGVIPERRLLPGTISGGFALSGDGPEGVPFNGQIITDGVTRRTHLVPGTGNGAFPSDLIAPLALSGNLLDTVRGERVEGEVVGSGGDGRDRYMLRKAPLSWIEDASATDGIRPLIELRVSGVLWKYVPTLFTSKAGQEVYTLETDEENKTHVVFCNRGKCARPESGVGNIVATYYHGAGAAKPPPGSVTQIARPVKRLRRVHNPFKATGGRDHESLSDLRTNAPAAALTLGRAVSVQDFQALARTYPGIVNVAAGWSWAPRRQGPAVSVWVIGEVDATALQSWLKAQAAEDLPVRVVPAAPVPIAMTLSIEVDPAYAKDETRAAVKAALVDPERGLLAPANITIGGTLFRSALVKAAQTVPGVSAVTSLSVNGAALDWARRFQVGTYPHVFSVEVL